MPVTTPPTITALPAPPDPNDRSTFNARAYPWSVAQQTLATEVQALATNVFDNATEAGTQAGIATTQASNATTQAGLADTARIAAQAAQAAAEGVVASIPDGTINDGTTSLISVWSSSKVSADKQDTLVSGTNIKTVGGASLLGEGDLPVSSNLTYEARTSNTILGTGDKAKVIRYTAGGFAQTFTAAATLTGGWFVYLQNTSTSNVTLDPNSSETIDGLTTGVLAPGMALLVICTGTAFQVVRLDNSPITEVKTSGTSWTCPLGVVRAEVTVVGAGGSPSGSAGGGGGGTAVRNYRTNPGTSYTYAVGGGGSGTGGNSTFTDGTTLITGGGGLAATNATNAGGAATGGDINVPGGTGFYDSPMHVGGNSGLGYGRGSVFATSTGAHASGYGAGGAYGNGGDINSGGLSGVVIIKY